MARMIRFPLKMKNGADVRTIEELRQNFDLESVIGYFCDGKLLTWLKDRYFDDMVEEIKSLSADMPDFNTKLCSIIGVEYKEENDIADFGTIKRNKEKFNILKEVTDDKDILDNVEIIAINQDDLNDILNKAPELIYLYGDEFSIPYENKNVKYIGLNNPIIKLDKGKEHYEYSDAGIKLEKIRYEKSVNLYKTRAEQLYIEGKYKEAFPEIEKEAQNGNPRAMYIISMCYIYGLGVNSDEEKRNEWLKKSCGYDEPLSTRKYAVVCCKNDESKKNSILNKILGKLKELSETGDILAQFEYAWYLYNQENDKNKAFRIWENCAEKGFTLAQFHLGDMYYDDDSIEQNYEKAVYWLTKAAEQGDATAQIYLAGVYAESEDIEQAVYWLNMAAEQGHAEAQYELGACYNDGYGVDQDYEKAVEWYKKAAEQGNAEAQCSLGNMYYDGEGVKQNYAKAVELYSKSSKQGNAEAQYKFAKCYDYGNGVKTDYKKSAKLYRKSAENGYTAAQYELGLCYEKGYGVNENYEEALKWYTKAAEQGHVNAQNSLGDMYYNGNGVDENYEEALEWYTKAAEQGHAEAQNSLGDMYSNLSGVYTNFEEASKWYTKAAEQGHAGAQFSLGSMYVLGWGVDRNDEKAVYWLTKAAEQGNEDAQSILDNINDIYDLLDNL